VISKKLKRSFNNRKKPHLLSPSRERIKVRGVHDLS